MRLRLGLLAVVLVAVAGCGGSHPADRDRTTGATRATAAADRPCTEPGVRAQAIRFRTSDGVTLAGAVVGSGPVGAVLIHQYPRDYCGWLPYSGYLSRRGVRALLFDLRCFGRSPGAAASRVTAPALFAVAHGDRYVPIADMRTVARRVRSATSRLIVLPATAGHGWDLLFGGETKWSPLAATVAAFIRRHASA